MVESANKHAGGKANRRTGRRSEPLGSGEFEFGVDGSWFEGLRRSTIK